MKGTAPKTFYGFILVFGLPGSGKSTLASTLADQLHAIHLNTDMVRVASGRLGRYTSVDKAAVYNELFNRAKEVLQGGATVILDGTFSSAEQREHANKLAVELDVPAIWIEVQADEAVIKKRISVSRPYTEADFAIYTLIRSQWKPLEEPHLTLQSDKDSLDILVRKALDWIHVDRQ